MTRDIITRRRVLAAVGSLGFLGASARVGRGALGLERVEFTRQMQINESESMPDVLLNWRETYNGAVLEESGFTTAPTAGPASPIVGLTDLVPGDEGSLTLQVALGEGETESTPTSARIRLTVELYENSDEGVNEPEREAGDVPGTVGDLGDAVELEIRYDDGCNGTDLPVLPDDPTIAAGTVVDVAEDSPLADGVELQSPGACFDVGESTCLTMTWTLPEGIGNVIQGDSLGFRLRFTPLPCSGGG
ncbi:MAG: hypothetical protein ABEJ90_04730 [Halobacterium sp.]